MIGRISFRSTKLSILTQKPLQTLTLRGGGGAQTRGRSIFARRNKYFERRRLSSTTNAMVSSLLIVSIDMRRARADLNLRLSFGFGSVTTDKNVATGRLARRRCAFECPGSSFGTNRNVAKGPYCTSPRHPPTYCRCVLTVLYLRSKTPPYPPPLRPPRTDFVSLGKTRLSSVEVL